MVAFFVGSLALQNLEAEKPRETTSYELCTEPELIGAL